MKVISAADFKDVLGIDFDEGPAIVAHYVSPPKPPEPPHPEVSVTDTPVEIVIPEFVRELVTA